MPKLIMTKRGLRFETPLKSPTSYRTLLQRLGLLTAHKLPDIAPEAWAADRLFETHSREGHTSHNLDHAHPSITCPL
jgi:hypothetical protein